MNGGTGSESGQNSSELQAIAAAVRDLALGCQGDSLALVALLRRLEELHREIRDGIFQTSLPDNRQALYVLLKDIETQGGWPYIERMKLQSFLANLLVEGEQGAESREQGGTRGPHFVGNSGSPLGIRGEGGEEEQGRSFTKSSLIFPCSLLPNP